MLAIINKVWVIKEDGERVAINTKFPSNKPKRIETIRKKIKAKYEAKYVHIQYTEK